MKLVVALNDVERGAHVDYHEGLARLRGEGRIDAFEVVPHVALRNEGHSDAAVVGMIETAATDLEADLILWCHTGELVVPDAVMDRLRMLPSPPVMAYVEGDMYQRFYKPLHKAARSVMCASDVVFVCGGGALVDQLARAGCHDVRYVPLTTDDVRFGADRPPGSEPDFDVVLVGNNPRSRVPFKTMPGCRWRARVVKMLEKRLGARFGVFGYGWDGPSAQGPVPFDEQGRAYHRGRVSLGINNLHAPYYFSDRLPISLSSGVLMVHDREAGLDEVFPQRVASLMFPPDEESVWSSLRRALELDDAALREAELEARGVALGRLTTYHALGYVLDVAAEITARRRDAGVQPVANPWLSARRLSGS